MCASMYLCSCGFWGVCHMISGQCLSRIKVCSQVFSCQLPVFSIFIGPGMGREVNLILPHSSLLGPHSFFFRGKEALSRPPTTQHTCSPLNPRCTERSGYDIIGGFCCCCCRVFFFVVFFRNNANFTLFHIQFLMPPDEQKLRLIRIRKWILRCCGTVWLFQRSGSDPTLYFSAAVNLDVKGRNNQEVTKTNIGPAEWSYRGDVQGGKGMWGGGGGEGFDSPQQNRRKTI